MVDQREIRQCAHCGEAIEPDDIPQAVHIRGDEGGGAAIPEQWFHSQHAPDDAKSNTDSYSDE